MKCGINCFQNDAYRHKLTNNKKEPYLDIGNGKQWRPAVAKVIASMVESEQKAKGMMAQGFKMSDSQWEYTYRCFELMNLDILAHLFSADGVLKRGS